MTDKDALKVKILSVVVCDDVREENNGKEILIGVYSGAITVHMIPSLPLPLRCWVNLTIQGPSKVKLYFRARDHDNKEIFQAQLETGTEDEIGMGSIPLGPIIYTLRDPEGSLKVDYKEGEGDWANIITKSVKYQSK